MGCSFFSNNTDICISYNSKICLKIFALFSALFGKKISFIFHACPAENSFFSQHMLAALHRTVNAVFFLNF